MRKNSESTQKDNNTVRTDKNKKIDPLDEVLNKITLSPEKQREIISSEALNQFTESIFGAFKITECLYKLMNFDDKIQEKFNEEKRKYLLIELIKSCKRNHNDIEKLFQFLLSMKGNILLNKVLNIANFTFADKEELENLSIVLKRIVQSDFEFLFEDHRFALRIIESLSPQSLKILLDYKTWPAFPSSANLHFGGSTLNITWAGEFSEEYCKSKMISDQFTKTKILFFVEELVSRKIIRKVSITQSKKSNVEFDSCGAFLIQYLE